jgi:hypothetical protein
MGDAEMMEAPGNAEKGCGGSLRPSLYVQWSKEDDDWSVDTSPSPRPKKKLKPLLYEPATGPHEITFELRPPAGETWKFRSLANGGPISTQDNCDCHDLKDGMNSDQLQDPRLASDKVLTVTNANDGSARLVRYKLHIEGAPSPECDPAILNGGSGNH